MILLVYLSCGVTFVGACLGAMSTQNEQKIAEGSTGSKSPDVVVPRDVEYLKHPLHNSWSWWFFKNDKARDWSKNLKYIASFQFVEDFWALHNHIQLVSTLPAGCDYSLFKEGIEPMWEDKANIKGGRWLLQTTKMQRGEHLDSYWLEVLLLLIGEAFGEDSDYICGAVVQIRNKGDKLAIWTRDTNRDVVGRIGAKFRQVLQLPPSITVSFHAHQDTMSKAGSASKGLMVL